MGIIALDYGCMGDAEAAARRAAASCKDYSDKIERKVTKKLSSLQGGSTGNTSSSSYFANQKMRNLNAKQENYIHFANQMKSAVKYANETDKAVSTYIKKESESFRKAHDMDVNKVVEWFTWFSTAIINKTEFGRWIADKLTDVAAWIDDKAHDFKRWYELDGGKYIGKAVLAAIGAIIAVAVLVCVAWPLVTAAFGTIAATVSAQALLTGEIIWGAITAAAAFATAVTEITNLAAKAYGNAQAYLNNEDDPGWAKRYGEYDSFSDMLRKELFSSEFANKLSYVYADVYDTVDIIANIINFAGLAVNGIEFGKKIKNGEVFKILDRVHFKSPNGKMTWGTFKYGIKHLLNNVKILKDKVIISDFERLKKANLKESLQKIEKIYKGINGGFKIIDKAYDSNIFKAGWDTVIEKIREKTIIWDFSHKFKENRTDIEEFRNKKYKVSS